MSGTTERSPRLDLYASVELAGGDEVLILTVRNLSLTGVLVAADGHDLAQFTVGNEYRLLIFDPDNERYQVEVLGRLVRTQPDAMAFSLDDEDALFRVESLIKRLSAKPPLQKDG
jgi:hypothetical protein